jgi:chaperonin GroEL
VVLINAVPALDEVKMELPDEQTGVNILRRALEEPMRVIVENAGVDGAVVVQEVRRLQEEKRNKNIGYDVIANDYGDMVEKGIIDPAKVTRSAVENAASIAAMILTTEALVTEIPEKEKPATPSMPPY